MRAALVRDSDGLVVNVIEISLEPPPPPSRAWVSPPGHTVVSAQRPDGSYRYVGPGFRYDAQAGRFLRPDIQAPAQLAVGQQGTVTLRWVDESLQPVAYQRPITLEVMGMRQSYTPGPDGSVQVPFRADVAGDYELRVVEPELGAILNAVVVTVQ